MAKKLGTPLVAAALQRLFDVKGRYQLGLEEFIIPTVRIADLSIGSSPPVTRHVSVFFTISGVALERALWRLETPGGTLAVVSYLSVRANVSTGLNVNFGSSIAAADIPNIEGGSFTDGRLGTLGELPAAIVAQGTRVATLTGNWQRLLNVAPDIWEYQPKGWIVGSGNPTAFGFLEFGVGDVNEAVNVTMEWDEYQIF